MKVLRTPDDRFVDLPDWPYEPNYVTGADPDGGEPLRMHYVDEGPPVGPDVLLLAGIRMELTDAEAAADDAPFPDASHQAGVLQFPALADAHGDEGEPYTLFSETWSVLTEWEKPLVCRYDKADPVLGWFDDYMIAKIPGAAGQPHATFPDGGHFIQEQETDSLVEAILHVVGGR